MKSVSHWPKNLYLITSGNTLPNEKPSPKTMGSKAYNLLRMAKIGLPVPPAFVIGTHYTKFPDECMLPVFTTGLTALQEAVGLIFGDSRKPLIVSVRSGAPVSMPGMLETLLNIGLCDQTVGGLLRQTGNPRLVWDAYRRLIANYGEVVAGLPIRVFEDEIKRVTEGRDERLLDFKELRELTHQFLSIYQLHAGQAFPQNVNEQLSGAIRAVFASWNAKKAVEYRKIMQIDSSMGTAVAIQCMVFGNSGGHAGAGVGFTRDPVTGERRLWVDFLANAQGEDLVSGRRNAHGHQVLTSVAPKAWQQLEESVKALEGEFKDMQDFEFTVQDGLLYMLQTRSGKRTPLARARIALDLMDEGIINPTMALERTDELKVIDIGTLRLSTRDKPKKVVEPVAHATPASAGVVTGEIALDGIRLAARAGSGASLILIRQDTQTSDIAELELALGILTQRGARTSHAAVVARQLGKVCLVGCESLRIDLSARTIQVGEAVLNEGDVITLDGNDGAIYCGAIAAVMVPDAPLLKRLKALRAQQSSGHSDHKHDK
jgi:pyruvate,orthophosphate dikinase